MYKEKMDAFWSVYKGQKLEVWDEGRSGFSANYQGLTLEFPNDCYAGKVSHNQICRLRHGGLWATFTRIRGSYRTCKVTLWRDETFSSRKTTIQLTLTGQAHE